MNKLCRKRRHHSVVTFRKWGRKSYSVFQTLHKTIRIGCLSVGYLLFAIPSNAERNMMVAPHDSISSIKGGEMEEVVVSAQRAPVTFSQTARILTIIEKDEIQKAPIQSAQDLLEYVAGVDLRQRGGLGVQSDVSIRGSSFDQVLILLNGISINDPQTGHHNLNLPVSLDAIERIEILEGPASRVYGLNAFSGAINIITSSDNHSNVRANLSAGQYSYWDGGLSGNLVSGKLSNFISVDHRNSDGYTKNTDFKLVDFYYLGKLSLSKSNFQVQAGQSNRAFGSNSFYTPVYPDQFENTRTSFASVKLETGLKFHFSPTLYWRRNQDRFELFRYPDQTPSWYKGHNYHLTETYGTNLNSWFSTDLGKTSAGVEFRCENIWSTVLGHPMENQKKIPGEQGKFFGFSDYRNNYSLYLEHTIYFHPFTLSVGTMANYNSAMEKWNYSPGIDFSWMLFKQHSTDWKKFSELKFYSSYNKSLRMPTFTDLYYSSPTNMGNPDLKPEEATAFEAGLKFSNPILEGHLSYFDRWGTNIIDWVRTPGETIWRASNITTLNTQGIEASIKIMPGKVFESGSFIKTILISYSGIDQGKESGLFLSKYVLDYLRKKVVLGLNHSIVGKLGADWQFTRQERNGTYTKWNGSAYGSEVPYSLVNLLNTRIYWQQKNLMIYVEAANLLDQRYIDYGNIEQPGRWIKVGFRKQFDLETKN